MSVESEILRIQHNIANTYAAVTDKGGEVPLRPTSANLAAAVASIPVGVTQEELSQALLTKQDKLVGQPGQVVGFDSMGLAYAVPGWSNPNLLDNWYFADPVNQRGQTEYTAIGYTIDRFILQNTTGEASVKIEDGCVKLYAKNNDGLLHRLEIGTLLYNTMYICSVLTKNSGLLTAAVKTPLPGSTNVTVVPYPGTIWNIAVGFPLGNGVGYFWPAITYNQTSLKEIDIVAAKLELGPVQTLAHQDADGNWVLNDPPPNKALELAKCQRYFVRYGSADRQSLVGYGVPYSTTKATMQISLPVPMRATPAVVKSGVINLSSAYNVKEVSKMLVAYVTQNELTLDITSEELTIGEMSRLSVPAGSYLDFNSDL